MHDTRSRLEIARRETPSATDDELVRAIAAGLIDELGITEPPVDMEMVASLLGIHSVVVDDALPSSGCLLRRPDGRFEIRVQGTEPPTRQRFTVGHECGHTFLPGYATRTRYRCSPLDSLAEDQGIEALSNLAASELLLPSRMFEPEARAAAFGFESVEALADRYEASLEATGRRLVDTWRVPTALVVLSVRQKPSERGTRALERLRVDYVYTGGAWPYFLRHKSATPGDALDRAGRGETVSERCTINGICAEPVTVDVQAQPCPVTIDGARRERVIALLRRADRRR